MPTIPAPSARSRISPISTPIKSRSGTPTARMVRIMPSRCSKASPIDACTMKRPTMKARNPNAVRLRWKLSVSRERSPASSGSVRRSSSPVSRATSAVLARSPGPRSRRETCPGRSSTVCATPMSTMRRPGVTSSIAVIGGKVCPRSVTSADPPAAVRSLLVAGETTVCQGGFRKCSRRSVPCTAPSDVPSGMVSGSMPMSRNALPPMRTVPSSTGDTLKPARRSAEKMVLSEKGAARADNTARASIPEHGSSTVIALACLAVQRLHAAPQGGCNGEANDERGEIHGMPAPVTEQRRQYPVGLCHGAANTPEASVT